MSEIPSFQANPVECAALAGNLNMLSLLIAEQNYDPKQRGTYGRALLHYACLGGQFDVVKYLIEEHQLDPLSVDDCNKSSFCYACEKGYLHIVRYLVNGQSVDPANFIGSSETPLQVACQNGHLDVVKFLIDEKGCDYAQTAQTSDDTETVPLYLACVSGHLDVVKYLMDKQPVDVPYASGDNCYLPLHVACIAGHLEVVKFLIEEKGCDVTETFQNKAGLVYNVLDLASINGCVDVARYLIEEMHCDPKGDPTSTHTPLILACEAGHSDMVKYLVNEKSINPFCEQDSGDTPFHVACKKGQLEIVKYLIEEKGCDPMYNNGKSIPPYSLACTYGHLNVVRYLTEERKCDPLCKDVGSVTAVDVAAGYSMAVLKYFIEERKCDVNASRLLVFAIRLNNFEAVQYLSAIETSGTTAKGTSHTHSTSRGLSSSGSHLSEPINPQRKRKQQDANEVPQHVLHPQYKIEATPTNIPLSGILRHLLSQRQQGEVPQQTVELEGEVAQPVTGHLQETHSGPRKQSSSSRQLPPSGESHLPQRKQDAIKVSQQKKHHLQHKEVPLSPLPQHHLNPEDLAFLMNHLKPVANHWRAVGLQLGLLYGELGVIEATPLLIPGGPVAYLQEVLSRWLNRAPPLPTLKNLCDALRSHAVDQSRIALELQQQYQTQRAARRWEDDPELKPLVKKAEPTGRQLGVGAYGSVEQVKVEGTMCAAKRFRVEIYKSPTSESHEKFFAELRILCSIRHPNIVQYHCVCYLPNSKSPALVMEQLQTNLHDYLLNPSYANLPLSAKVSILQDIARGLAYLHDHKPAVIHRDLTARNVLLNSDRVAKISDFGNSRIIDVDPACSTHFQSTSRVPGTIIYMPPEACSDHAKFNEKLDIFSFGHLALFTATQVFPCDLLPATFCDDDGKVCARTEVERRQRYIDQLEQQLGGDHDLVKLIKQCLHNSPKVRPTANDTVCILEQLVAVTQTWFIQ